MSRRASNPVKAFRRGLYRWAKVIGDFTAIQDGSITKRVVRRITGKYTARGLTGFMKSFFK